MGRIKMMLNLYYDARLYSWNILTIRAIEAGIQSAYAEEVANSGAIFDEISTPLPGAVYSLWPYSNRSDLTKYFSIGTFEGMYPEHGEKDVGKKRGLTLKFLLLLLRDFC
jgi:hypothetical protein